MIWETICMILKLYNDNLSNIHICVYFYFPNLFIRP